MSRLPEPGGDYNIWGEILNDYLLRSLDVDGTLRVNIVGSGQLQSGAVTGAKIAGGTITSSHVADGSLTQDKVQNLTSSLAAKLNASQVGVAGGVAALNNSGQLAQPVDAAKITTGTIDISRLPDLSTLYAPAGQGAGLTLITYDGSTEAMKLLRMQDGSVKAIPVTATAPPAPTGLAVDVHLSYVIFSWQSVSGATQYQVYRDGSLVSTISGTSYLDENITVGQTYQYTVIAVNTHGMWSTTPTAVPAFINPAINSAPTIASITVWPTNPRPNEKVYVHVNAVDVDVQELATTLGVSAGSLQATFDPSTWVWQGV